jgi:hypothetical protein
MPLKGQAKLDYQKKWRKEKIKTGYGKWLYHKRALRYADAGEFRIALEQIASGETSPADLAQGALDASRDRWSELEEPVSVHLKGQGPW